MEYTIEAFVEKLLKEKGMTGLSPEVMAQLKSDLHERAENLINAEILAVMPKDALTKFEKVLDTEDAEKIEAFCKEHVENLEEVVAGALLKLQRIYATSSVA